jgi:hypothetical protein
MECIIPDCSNQVRAKSLCSTHYNAARDLGPCAEEGCLRPAFARGWCNTHYQRWRTTGDMTRSRHGGGKKYRFFMEHVMEPSEGCRIWPYGKRAGYGAVCFLGQTFNIHARTCELWYGPRPRDHETAHSCDTPACWAGEHLRWATHHENVADRVERGRSSRGPEHAAAIRRGRGW